MRIKYFSTIYYLYYLIICWVPTAYGATEPSASNIDDEAISPISDEESAQNTLMPKTSPNLKERRSRSLISSNEISAFKSQLAKAEATKNKNDHSMTQQQMINELQSELQGANTQIEALTSSNEELRLDLTKVLQELEQHKYNIIQRDDKIKQLTSIAEELQNELRSKQENTQNQPSSLKESPQTCNNVRNDLYQCEENNEQQKTELTQLQQQVSGYTQEIQQLKESIKKLEDKLQQSQEKLSTDTIRLKGTIQKHEKNAETLTIEIEQLSSELIQYKKQIQSQQNLIENLQTEVNQLRRLTNRTPTPLHGRQKTQAFNLGGIQQNISEDLGGLYDNPQTPFNQTKPETFDTFFNQNEAYE